MTCCHGVFVAGAAAPVLTFSRRTSEAGGGLPGPEVSAASGFAAGWLQDGLGRLRLAHLPRLPGWVPSKQSMQLHWGMANHLALATLSQKQFSDLFG